MDDNQAEGGNGDGGRAIGTIIGILAALSLAALKLYDFGADHDWALSADLPFVTGLDWQAHGTKIAIIVAESVAAAAAISVAFTYVFVTNNFTTYVSNKIINKVTDSINENYVTALNNVNENVQRLGGSVAGFEQKLHAHHDDDITTLERFLAFARDRQLSEKDTQLQHDDALFTRIADEMSKAIHEWRESRRRP